MASASLARRPSSAVLARAAPCLPPRRDDLHHRLGLGQAHAAILQRPAGELAGAGRHRTRGDQRLLQPVRHGAAPVHRQLDHVLAGVAVGSPVKQRHRLVHLPAVQQVVAEQRGVALGRQHGFLPVDGLKDPGRDGIGLRPGQGAPPRYRPPPAAWPVRRWCCGVAYRMSPFAAARREIPGIQPGFVDTYHTTKARFAQSRRPRHKSSNRRIQNRYKNDAKIR